MSPRLATSMTLKMDWFNGVQIFPAEVKEVIYSDKNPILIYGIKVKQLNDSTGIKDESSIAVETAIPLNYNVIRVPLVGEVVLVLRAPSSYTTGVRFSSTLYYIDIVSLQSSKHHNSLPTVANIEFNSTNKSTSYAETSAGNVNKPVEPTIDKNFQENSNSKPLQHYVGDVLLSGRYGHSIRFSTTPKSGNFTVQPEFSGAEGKPITIIRNTTEKNSTGKVNDFVTEKFTNDENLIVMASGQNLKFEQSSKALSSINKQKITSWKDEQWGRTPQILVSSGRIVFNSSQKEIIAFAKNGIGLSSETSIGIDAKATVSINGKKIELGTDADEPIILGNKWKTWAENLIDTLATVIVVTPAGPSSPLSASPQWASIAGFKGQIPTLLSEQSFVKKLS